jgi:alpha-L-fucosidase
LPRYYKYVKNQTREILEKYGPLGVYWFDGEWEDPWTREYGNELYDYLKGLQPGLLINNRVSKGRQGMEGTTQDAELNAGDFDTPEQRVGTFNRERPWETCMTLGKQWAWKPDEDLKSATEAIQTLLRVVGGDGNLLLNVGPRPDGRIDAGQAEVLVAMGEWLSRNGEYVYGTRGGPFEPGEWGASTSKDDRIYLFIIRWSDHKKLNLPPLPVRVLNHRTLSEHNLTVKVDESGFEISGEGVGADRPAAVLELKVQGNALKIPPLRVPEP